MPKVICTLSAASSAINGVKFESHDKGRISEEISPELAAEFMQIPGFEMEAEPVVAVEPDPELDALRAEAAEIGMDFDNRWKSERLKTEIGKFKKAAEKAAQKKAEEKPKAPVQEQQDPAGDKKEGGEKSEEKSDSEKAEEAGAEKKDEGKGATDEKGEDK